MGPLRDPLEAKKAAHDCAHGIAAGAGTEVEHQPGVAGKTGRHGFAQELLDEPDLADARLAPTAAA